ncbi:MAG TPA: glycosyltransferase family 4 protein, partial [Candidatus Saccharimonadales bacterium]|nr:glycosyltransferase family 4 protein [Candidatus Saccharimonadales bacterium]
LKAAFIPCGYDEHVYRVKPELKRKSDVLLAVGRSFFQKNFVFSFESWKALGETRPNFWLFGSEPDMKSLDEKITYHTKPSDAEVNNLYNQATVFVQTSRHEGFCLPILEAMAAGAPVICTDAHGNRDFSIDGKTCLMVEQDNKKELTAALNKLFTDKKLRDKLSKNALKEVQKYTWPVVTDQLVEFYADIEKQSHITKKVKEKYGQ